MVIYCVDVHVVQGREEDFRRASEVNHQKTRLEPGNLRFDVLQSEDDPGHFLLYEVYGSDEAVRAHKETGHYKAWRETVAPWMARERAGRRFRAVCPGADEGW